MYVGSSFVFSSGDERCGRSCLACTLHACFNAFVRCARDIRFRLVWLDVVKRVLVLGFGPQWFEVARFLCGAYARDSANIRAKRQDYLHVVFIGQT